MRVARLGPGDACSLGEMMAVFGRAFEDEDTYGRAPPSAAYRERLLARDDLVALVVREEGVILGGLAAYRLDKFEQERSEFYIYDLAVAAEHWRRGIATALIATLRDIASVEGARVIFVQADYGDDPAVALYTKLGTREDVMHFDIEVADINRFDGGSGVLPTPWRGQ